MKGAQSKNTWGHTLDRIGEYFGFGRIETRCGRFASVRLRVLQTTELRLGRHGPSSPEPRAETLIVLVCAYTGSVVGRTDGRTIGGNVGDMLMYIVSTFDSPAHLPRPQTDGQPDHRGSGGDFNKVTRGFS